MGLPYWSSGLPCVVPEIDTTGLNYWVDGLPFEFITNSAITVIEIAVDEVTIDVTPSDISTPIRVNFEETVNLAIDALTLMTTSLGVSVDTENILIVAPTVSPAHLVNLGTGAIDLLILDVEIGLVSKRVFPLPPINRLLQTQMYKRKFPVGNPILTTPSEGGSFSFAVTLAEAGDFTLPITSGVGTYHDFTVDWDDGSGLTHITAYNDAAVTHSYAAAGVYNITMTGRCDYFNFREELSESKLLVTELLSFTGDIGFKTLNFAGCINITTVVPLGTLKSLTTASYMFSECVLITTIPEGMFAGCPNIEDFDYTFQSCQVLETLPIDLFRYNTKVTSFKTTFGWCYNFPATVPTDLFRYNNKVTTFRELFTYCSLIDTIPADIFKYNPLVTDFSYVFDHKENLVTIPEDLFRYNVLATDFHGAFAENYILENVPVDLFRYNVLATDFHLLFYQSGALASVPVDLFRYNVLATNFYGVFYSSAIAGVPVDLFRYNVLATDFGSVFWVCENLETVSDDLFRYNVLATNFRQTFYGCPKLQINPYTFYNEGEAATRFLNKNIIFENCFKRDSFTGNQGVAPDLWNCDFGSGTPTKTDCFDGAGNSLTSISNYESIPVAWGGPA